MSTLNVSNITDGTTTVGTSYVVNGSAKAWVNFNGTGTIAIRDSINVASLVDNATGNYSVNYTSNMSADDYSVAGASDGSDTTTYMRNLEPAIIYSGSSTWKSAEAINGGTVLTVDKTGIYVTIHGDLA